MNLGGEHDWNFSAQPNPSINGRSLPLSMGKVLGGGSSINLMIWSRGHKNDWDFFAEEADMSCVTLASCANSVPVMKHTSTKIRFMIVMIILSFAQTNP
jgi:choline dehydrogenase-like flavoprotein